jgi:hypothetical protein
MLSEEERKKHQDANSYSATEGGGGGGGGGEDDGDFDGSSREEEEEDSMISDAASRAPADALFPVRYKGLRKLKKQAFKALGHDDSLEDTASSPVNSPKVSQAINYPSFLLLKLDCMLMYRNVNLVLFLGCFFKVSAVSQLELSPKRRCNIRDLTKVRLLEINTSSLETKHI